MSSHPLPQRPKTVLREKEVTRRIKQSASSIDRMIAEGTFPKPIRLGQRAKGWFEHEVDEWLDARAAERDRAA